jgi:hypothetical protein
MRWGTFVIPVALYACTSAENRFVVDDAQTHVVAATLVLCGSETPLQRNGKRLTLSKPITCEGSGYIRLRYTSGDDHVCPVGYVTPGMEQDFTYRTTETGCE